MYKINPGPPGFCDKISKYIHSFINFMQNFVFPAKTDVHRRHNIPLLRNGKLRIENCVLNRKFLFSLALLIKGVGAIIDRPLRVRSLSAAHGRLIIAPTRGTVTSGTGDPSPTKINRNLRQRKVIFNFQFSILNYEIDCHSLHSKPRNDKEDRAC